MSEYIKREDAEQSIVGYFTPKTYDGNDVDRAFKIAGAILNHIPPADVVEVGCITCFGIKFIVEDDIIKVKWRHGDKHYIVPLLDF